MKAKNGDEELGTAEARFLVPNQDLELDRPGGGAESDGATGRDDQSRPAERRSRRRSCRSC